MDPAASPGATDPWGSVVPFADSGAWVALAVLALIGVASVLAIIVKGREQAHGDGPPGEENPRPDER